MIGLYYLLLLLIGVIVAVAGLLMPGNLDGYIVETYHPVENGEEEVEIYLPIKA